MEIWFIRLRKSVETRTFLILKKEQKLDIHFKNVGYDLNIMRQTVCLVHVYPIMVDNYAALFRCVAVVQVSNSMTALI